MEIDSFSYPGPLVDTFAFHFHSYLGSGDPGNNLLRDVQEFFDGNRLTSHRDYLFYVRGYDCYVGLLDPKMAITFKLRFG